MRKVTTKKEGNFLTQAVFNQLDAKQFDKLFKGEKLSIIHPATRKKVQIRWERQANAYYVGDELKEDKSGKEKNLKIERYQSLLNDATDRGTKCNMALKALKEVPYPNPVISDAIDELAQRLDHHSRVAQNALHNIIKEER